ncbi:MAG: bacteriohopanetetrol glucosamine biosynthesis glycosyltransferase HpnI, partial [Caulobacteraceae bacterium]|nr:bacteriohopanetetrol glucosamine biosynthesis glycosyltransferase HpnI [Caulobacteraceae bacterium]
LTALAGAWAPRFLVRSPPAPAAFPAVSLLKPLHGAPHGLAEALETFCRQDYPGQAQIVLGVAEGGDPAAVVVRDLQARHPEMDIRLVVDGRRHGANRKVSNLINLAREAQHEILILSDADIAVTPAYLSAVVAALDAPGVGAVSCLYVGRGKAGAWSRLSAMGTDYEFLPNAILGIALGLARPCFGSTIALTRETLGRIGGFEAVADYLADDYEIGRAVRRLGLCVAIPPVLVAHLCHESSAAELIEHEIRWARTVRLIDPAGHAGSLITYAFPLALLAGALTGFTPAALGLIFTILVVRIGVKFRIDAATGGGAGPWWLIPPRDVLSFCVFLASFAGRSVTWRGRRFRVSRDGVLADP